MGFPDLRGVFSFLGTSYGLPLSEGVGGPGWEDSTYIHDATRCLKQLDAFYVASWAESSHQQVCMCAFLMNVALGKHRDFPALQKVYRIFPAICKFIASPFSKGSLHVVRFLSLQKG